MGLLGRDTLEVWRLETITMRVPNQVEAVAVLGAPVVPELPVWLEREEQV